MKKLTNKSTGIQVNWIIVAIYLSIFINSYIFFKEPFEFYFGYIVYLILLPVFMLRHPMHRGLLLTFLTLLFTGLTNVFLDNNTTALFFKVFTGLFFSYLFYYYVIVEFDFNVEQLFKWYLKGCYWVSWLGIFQFIMFEVGFEPGYTFGGIFNKWGFTPGGLFGIRINSIFAEPTHLGAVMAGAFFVAAYNLVRKEPFYLKRYQGWVIMVVYFLSFSGLGQAGILLTVIFLSLNFGFFRYILVAIPMVMLIFNILYNNVTDFKERYDGIVGLFSGKEFKLGETHGSSFILYNNFVVASENFKKNYLFGSGIGSHPMAFEKYSLARNFKIVGLSNNAADANSMLLRLISETGLFGVSLFLFVVFKCYVRRDERYDTYHWLISNSILIMILLNLFRQGHYFLNGFPFFVMLYYFNYSSYREYVESANEENAGPADMEQAISS